MGKDGRGPRAALAAALAAAVLAGAGTRAVGGASPSPPSPSPSASPSPPAASPSPTARVPEVRVSPVDGLEYVRVPPGWFAMGCSPLDKLCQNDELPRHSVHVRGFWASRTEYTVAAYRRFAKATGYVSRLEAAFARAGSRPQRTFTLNANFRKATDNIGWHYPGFPQKDDHPVLMMAWPDAVEVCSWSGGRLPTEAEWEYMARGGEVDQVYPWQSYTPVGQANYTGDKYDRGDSFDLTSPVRSFPPNGFGLHDVIGNAWEWTADWYDRSYYRVSPSQDPRGPASGSFKVRRGGSFLTRPESMRLSSREWAVPTMARDETGIRCVRDSPP